MKAREPSSACELPIEEQKVWEIAEELCERCHCYNTCYLEAHGGYCDLVIAEAKRLLSKPVNLSLIEKLLRLRNRNA